MPTINCHHFLENYLPLRQSYINDLIRSLDGLSLQNYVWTFRDSNASHFQRDLYSFDNLSPIRKMQVRMKARLSGTSSYLAQMYLDRRQQFQKPAVAHMHFLWMAGAGRDLKKQADLPVCLTSYGEDEIFRGETRNLIIASESADAILTPSKYLFTEIEKHIGSDKLRLWHIGIETGRYEPVVHVEKDDPIIMAIGRLIERKGFKFLVEAIPLILRAKPSARFILVGEGPEEANLREQARQLGIPNHSLSILAYQSSLLSFYSQSDVFVLPSIIMPDGITEGLGVPLLEAQASSLPVVASNVGGIPESVEDGRTGTLVPHSDSAALAEAILKLLADRDLRESYGGRGRTKMQAEFELSSQAKELADIYLKIVDSLSYGS